MVVVLRLWLRMRVENLPLFLAERFCGTISVEGRKETKPRKRNRTLAVRAVYSAMADAYLQLKSRFTGK